MIYAGGIWSIAVGSGLAFGYARVFNATRWVYLAIIGFAFVIALLSQFLPPEHPFYASVRADLVFLIWAGIIAVPVFIYALFVRWARGKAEARNDSRTN